MPVDLQSIADPRLIVLSWAAGLALVAGAISLRQIVGSGFTWLAAGTSAVIALAGVFTEGAWWARVALLLLILGIVWARNRPFAGVILVAAGVCLVVETSLLSGWIPAVTGALALGGVTGEMILGHWYLIDPRLPRSALRTLALVGIVGLATDSTMLSVAGLPDSGATIAYWVLAGTSVLLMVAVVAALRYPAYSGVMAATGLSYLAVLTTLGAVFLGRALVAGLGPFVT